MLPSSWRHRHLLLPVRSLKLRKRPEGSHPAQPRPPPGQPSAAALRGRHGCGGRLPPLLCGKRQSAAATTGSGPETLGCAAASVLPSAPIRPQGQPKNPRPTSAAARAGIAGKSPDTAADWAAGGEGNRQPHPRPRGARPAPAPSPPTPASRSPQNRGSGRRQRPSTWNERWITWQCRPRTFSHVQPTPSAPPDPQSQPLRNGAGREGGRRTGSCCQGGSGDGLREGGRVVQVFTLMRDAAAVPSQ